LIIKVKSNTERMIAADSYSNEEDMDMDELITSGEDNDLPISQESGRIQVAHQIEMFQSYMTKLEN